MAHPQALLRDLVKWYLPLRTGAGWESIDDVSAQLRNHVSNICDNALFEGLDMSREDLLASAVGEATTRCGRCFTDGEAVFSCLDCQSDPTCVLCADCFEHSAHANHRTVMQISEGGGYCDCGDPEAWTSDHACSKHAVDEGKPASTAAEDSDSMSKGLPSQLAAKLSQMSSDLVAQLCTALDINGLHEVADDEIDLSKFIPQGSSSQYLLVLYNDEVHSFDQVQGVIQALCNCDASRAFQIANVAHEHGRVVLTMENLESCKRKQEEVFNMVNLDIRIFSVNVLCEQEVIAAVFLWLKDIAGAAAAARRVVAEAVHGQKLEGAAIQSHSSPIDQIMVKYPFLWKYGQDAVREGSITLILLEPDLKRDLGLKFLTNYENLYNMRAPEFERQAYMNLTCQVFTVRSIAEWLVKEHNGVTKLLELLNQRIQGVCSDSGTIDCSRPSSLLGSDSSGGCYGNILNDVRYLLECGASDEEVSVISAIPTWLKFLSMMEGMDPHRRQIGFHVEFESTSWQNAILLQYSIVSVWPRLVMGCCRSKEDAARTVKLTIDSISESWKNEVQRVISFHGHQMLSFNVHKQDVSVHAPLERFLAAVIIESRKNGFELELPLELHDRVPNGYLALMERPIRTLVLSAQQKSNLWVRNGVTIPSILHHMMEWDRMGAIVLDLDVVICQIVAATINPSLFIATLVEKYLLSRWLSSDGSASIIISEDPQKTEYAGSMLMEFLMTLVHILGERYNPGVGKITKEAVIRREIIHLLFEEPLPFSKFNSHIPKSVLECDEFEAILGELSEFKQKADGSGSQYSLKRGLISEFDPYFLHFSAVRRQGAVAAASAMSNGAFVPPQPPPPWQPPFLGCGKLLVSTSLLAIIYRIVEAAAIAQKEKPLAIVTEGSVQLCLHICSLGLLDVDKSQEFAESMAVYKEQTSGTLLSCLLKLRQNEKWHNSKGVNVFGGTIDWLLVKLRQFDSPNIMEALQIITHLPDNVELATQNRKLRKAEAKERQARIVARFAKRQKDFIESLASSSGSGNAATVTPAEKLKFECLVCLETISDDDIESDQDHVVTFAFAQNHTACEHHGINNSVANGPVLTSCGHFMHSSCANVWLWNCLQSRLGDEIRIERIEEGQFVDFFCPLCNDIANTFLPCLPCIKPSPEEGTPVSQQINIANDISELMTSIKRHTEDFDAHESATIFSKSGPVNAVDESDDTITGLRDFCVKLSKIANLTTEEWGVRDSQAMHNESQNGFASLISTLGTTIAAITLIDRRDENTAHSHISRTHSSTLQSLARIVEFSVNHYRSQWNSLSVEFISNVFTNGPPTKENVFAFCLRGLALLGCRTRLGNSVITWIRMNAILCLVQAIRFVVSNPTYVSDNVTSGEAHVEQLDLYFQVLAPHADLPIETSTIVQSLCTPTLRQLHLLLQIIRGESVPFSNPSWNWKELWSAFGIDELTSYVNIAPDFPGKDNASRWLGISEGHMSIDLDKQLKPNWALHPRTLIELPQEFREIFFKCVRDTCPMTKKQRAQPSMCMFCGEIICTGMQCCSDENGRGPCSAHALKCGNGRGMFLQVKTCTIVLLDFFRGAHIDAPYVDSRGETDRGLKRGQPLFLQPYMYARLNQMFQNQRIVSEVCKKMRNNYQFRNYRHWLAL